MRATDLATAVLCVVALLHAAARTAQPRRQHSRYDYALSQIGHEMGHRWSAFVSARVNGETIPLGPTHWARELQAPAPFPFQRPAEASAMGGGGWQDNLDGTFTQLDDDYYVPATGYSYLDLYLMGLVAPSEVPDFFILRNLAPAGRDASRSSSTRGWCWSSSTAGNRAGS